MTYFLDSTKAGSVQHFWPSPCWLPYSWFLLPYRISGSVCNLLLLIYVFICVGCPQSISGSYFLIKWPSRISPSNMSPGTCKMDNKHSFCPFYLLHIIAVNPFGEGINCLLRNTHCMLGKWGIVIYSLASWAPDDLLPCSFSLSWNAQTALRNCIQRDNDRKINEPSLSPLLNSNQNVGLSGYHSCGFLEDLPIVLHTEINGI